MKKLIKNDEKFIFIDDEKNLIIEDLKIHLDKRSGLNHIEIPDDYKSILNRKYVCESRFGNSSEIILDNLSKSKSSSSSSSSSSIKLNWIDFLEEDEKIIYEELKKKAEKRLEKEKLMIEYENKIKEIEEMKKILGIE